MTTVDRLLARALLMNNPQVPADTVPYEDTAYSDLAHDGIPLWASYDRDLTDSTAAKHLNTLCEAVVSHSTAGQIADFITEQLPAPHGAWVLGCILQLTAAEDGARYWWQYAAGAGERAASYCLYLHHLALGDNHAAAFWREQTGIDKENTDSPTPRNNDAPAYSLNIDIPTALRILSNLSHLPPAAERGRTEAAAAVMKYVATAVTAGYARNPGYEIPLPGPDFADHITIILAATSSAPHGPHRKNPTATTLPNRRQPVPTSHSSKEQQEPDRIVEVEIAADEGSVPTLEEAIETCWKTPTHALAVREMDRIAVRLRYILDRRPQTVPEPRARAVQPS